jgi:hypothetical protein
MKQIFGDSQEDSSSDFEVSQHLTTFMGACERTREADVARPRQNRHVKMVYDDIKARCFQCLMFLISRRMLGHSVGTCKVRSRFRLRRCLYLLVQVT